MRTLVRHLVLVGVVALSAMTAVTIVTPAVSSAECATGEFWDPAANECRAQGGPIAQPCDPGQWQDPAGDECRPRSVDPQP